MKISYAPLAALLIGLSAAAMAQTRLPPESGSPIKPPSNNGIAGPSPGSSVQTPSDPGIVTTPPKVGPENIKTPPKNVDPEIAGATEDIDRENRRKSEEKRDSRKRPDNSKSVR